MTRNHLVLAALLAVSMATPAFDKDAGQWDDVPDNIKSWFKNVRSPHGIPCCDIADGHRTEWRTQDNDGRYWVPIEGEWTAVPPDAVVYDAGNPFGEAVVWYVRQYNGEIYIRCFVPGGGV